MKGIIIIAGSTGAGKTTHAKILAAKTGATYISSGDIARSFMDADTDAKFKEGQLSPHEERIRTEIFHILQRSEVVILDGFPRVADQLNWLQMTGLGNNGPYSIFVIRLDWPVKVLVGRWMERMRDAYDTLSAYVRRDKLYRDETLPLFQNCGLVVSHEAEQDIMQVSCDIRKAVVAWLAKSVPTFKCKDSPQAIAISKFIFDHHIQMWEPGRHLRTWVAEPDYVEGRLWGIINAK